MNGNQAYVLSKRYTDDTVIGGGALKGRNCTITSIVNDAVNKVTRVTFDWLLDDGTHRTDVARIPFGSTPESATFDSNGHLIFTLDNGATIDAGIVPHARIITQADSTSNVSPEFGENVTTVDSVVRDSNGHVLKINKKTVKLPNLQYTTMPTAASMNGKIIQYIGETTSEWIKGTFYSSDGTKWEAVTGKGGANERVLTQAEYDALPDSKLTDGITYFISDGKGGVNERVLTQAEYDALPDSKLTDGITYYISDGQGGGGGDAVLTVDVTANMNVGAIASGDTLEKNTTFTEFVQKLLITEIAPTTTFTASGSGVKEAGTSVTPTLTLTINNKGTGTPVSIKFYDGSTLLDTQTYVDGTNTYTYTMGAVTTTTTVKGILEYTKSDQTSASIEKTASYTFIMASYYGAVSVIPTDKADIIALTKNVKNTKSQTATFNLSNQRSCYAYPASFGNLTSIKDSNNFEYISSYTKTTVAVDGVDYNVYTLTDPVTATGFRQVYA